MALGYFESADLQAYHPFDSRVPLGGERPPSSRPSPHALARFQTRCLEYATVNPLQHFSFSPLGTQSTAVTERERSAR